MKLSLEYAEVVHMLSRELGRDIQKDDITITQEPFCIEISGLDFEELLQIRAARSQGVVAPVRTPTHLALEAEAEKPMVEVPPGDAAAEIAGLLGDNQRLTQSEGGAGPVPNDPHSIPNAVTETPEDFLPPGATYEPPGDMSPEEIRGRNR